MSDKTLNNWANELAEKLDSLEGGEENVNFDEKLDEIALTQDEIYKKVDSILGLISYWVDLNEARAKEIKRLRELKSVTSNKIESLRNYLLFNLRKLQINKMETVKYKISVKQKPKKLVIHDLDSLPEHCKKITIEPAKRYILQEVRAGNIPSSMAQEVEQDEYFMVVK